MYSQDDGIYNYVAETNVSNVWRFVDGIRFYLSGILEAVVAFKIQIVETSFGRFCHGLS